MISNSNNRNPFKVQNYYPGPGYYDNNKSFQENTQDKTDKNTKETFSKERRFKNMSFDVGVGDRLGPGSYKLQSEFDKKPAQTNRGLKCQDTFKINTIPSIPSYNITTGYQEIGEGLLILMKGNKSNQQDHVGPSTYQPNLVQIKPRISGTVIKKETPKKRMTQMQQPTVSLIPQKEIQNAIELQNQQKKLKEQIEKEQKKQQNQQQQLFKQQKKERHKEYNLELLLMREKMQDKSGSLPAPGQYYNEQQFSSFNIKPKQAEFQCFESMAQRFQGKEINSVVGPGQYEIMHIDKAKALKFSKEQRQTNTPICDYNIDPGQYQGEIIRKNKQRTISVDFPSVFGSGQSRFSIHGEEEAPGVGTYNLQNKQKKRHKQVTKKGLKKGNFGNTFQVRQDDQETEVRINQQIEFTKTQINEEEDLKEKEKQKKEMPTNSFASKMQRFMNPKVNDTAPTHSYIMKNNLNNIETKTFNQKNSLFSKSERNQINISKSNNKNGPGRYDYNIDIVKKKISVADLVMR